MLPESIPVLDPLRFNTAYSYGYYNGIADGIKLAMQVLSETPGGRNYQIKPTLVKYRDQATTKMAEMRMQQEAF
jgi:hypothetical protein